MAAAPPMGETRGGEGEGGPRVSIVKMSSVFARARIELPPELTMNSSTLLPLLSHTQQCREVLVTQAQLYVIGSGRL